MNNNKINNRLKEIAQLKGVNNKLIALKLNVHHTTVSQWMNNHYQPNNEHTNKLLDLLEVAYHDLIIVNEKPKDTGLGKALQKEYDDLIKNKKLPLRIKITNKETGIEESIYNPEIVNIIQELENEHKKKNNSSSQ